MNEAIIEKLQKILALAGDRGATPGEVEAALCRAKELAIKHGIELASLPARTDSKSRLTLDIQEETGLKTSTRYEHPYHAWVINTLQEVFDVRFILWRGRIGSHPYLAQIHVIGEATDVAIVLALFPWLERLFPKIYGEAVKQGRLRKNFADANGCYMGLYRGIVSANERQEAAMPAADQQTWAMVLRSKDEQVDALVALKHPKLKAPKRSRKNYSHNGHEYGKERGEQIKLHQLDTVGAAAELSQ